MQQSAKSNEEVEKAKAFQEETEILPFTTYILLCRGIYV
jgi:hypothetical protein